jgi:hypothetical protein
MSGKFQSILLGALVIGILGAAYFVVQFSYQSQILGTVVCCVVPTVGALLAVWHFTTTNSLTISAGEGAMIGLLAGLLGYVFTDVLAVLMSLIGVSPSPFDVDAIVDMARQNMVNQGQDPEIIDQATEMTRKFFWAFALVGLVANAVFGAIVGAIGASFFKRGEAPAV